LIYYNATIISNTDDDLWKIIAEFRQIEKKLYIDNFRLIGGMVGLFMMIGE
jgi:hypothetical protein